MSTTDQAVTFDRQPVNGWANRATWAAATQIQNDEMLDSYAAGFAGRERDLDRLAHLIHGLARDCMTYAARQDVGPFDRVNWREIADAYRQG